jgi:hypothetical protein
MSGRDHRIAERVPILGDLHGEMMVFQTMLIRDISIGGVTIETRFALHIDSLHDVRLTLGTTSVVVKCRVAHSRISDVDQDIVTYRTGLEFIEPSERFVAVIAGYLDSVKTNRSGV